MKKVNSFAPETYRKPPAGVNDCLLHWADCRTKEVSHFGNEPARFRSANAERAADRTANLSGRPGSPLPMRHGWSLVERPHGVLAILFAFYLPLWLQANPGRCTLDHNNFCISNAPLTITPSVNCRPNRKLGKLAKWGSTNEAHLGRKVMTCNFTPMYLPEG